MVDSASLPPNPTDSAWLEELVAEALEALDRGGEAALERFLASQPTHRGQILALITRFRHTGLLRRDAKSEFPERLGEFRLRERLGAGGMGVVFVAEQESLGRSVALKVIRPDLLFFEGARERFRREIEVVARLSHPGIVPIVATGEHDGTPYYAMPLIEGASIDAVVRRLGRRDPAALVGADLWQAIGGSEVGSGATMPELFAGSWWAAVAQFGRQAAMALHHAHQRGVVHRDVKPSNVMLTADGRALLLDFGLALVQGDARLTRTGAEPGSPAFMAPEQLRGLGADERSDLYALAATLQTLLDLAQPFDAPDPQALRTKILHGQRQAPRNRAVPAELRLVLAAAMDLDRERRYVSAEAFAADLGAVLARRPIGARRLPMTLRLWRWGQRHRTAAALALVVVVVAAAWPLAWAWQAQRSLAAVAREKQRAEAGRDAALAAVAEFLVSLAGSDLLKQPTGMRVAGPLLDRAATTLAALEQDAPDRRLRVELLRAEQRLVTLLRLAGRPTEARDRALGVLAAWAAEPEPEPVVALARARLRQELCNLVERGVTVPDAAELPGLVAADLARAELAATLHTGVAECRRDLQGLQALAAARAGDPAAADAWWEQLLAAPAAAGAAGPDLAIAVERNRYAQALAERGELARAEALFRQTAGELAPALDRVLGRPEALHVWGHAVWGIGQTLLRQQQLAAAEPFYAEARWILEASAAAYPDQPSHVCTLAACFTEYGQLLQQLRGDAAGLPLLERARRLFAVGAPAAAGENANMDHRRTNLRVLCSHYGHAGDRAALLGAARELASLPPNAEQFATAAWNLLRVAELAERAADALQAAECDAAALAALEACDAAGWFAPIDLWARPCQRLQADPRFEALRVRHPRSR